MNEEHFVNIIGQAEPMSINQQDYESIRRSLTGESELDFFSIIVGGKSNYLFRASSVAMIERRAKG